MRVVRERRSSPAPATPGAACADAPSVGRDLFKSELVDGRRFPSYEHAEHEVLHWIGFYNARLHENPGKVFDLDCRSRRPPRATRRWINGARSRYSFARKSNELLPA